MWVWRARVRARVGLEKERGEGGKLPQAPAAASGRRRRPRKVVVLVGSIGTNLQTRTVTGSLIGAPCSSGSVGEWPTAAEVVWPVSPASPSLVVPSTQQ